MTAGGALFYFCKWRLISNFTAARDYLHGRGYKFIEIDVERDRAAYEEMKELSDQSCVPTLIAGDEVLANFDTDQLEKFLSEHRIEP